MCLDHNWSSPRKIYKEYNYTKEAFDIIGHKVLERLTKLKYFLTQLWIRFDQKLFWYAFTCADYYVLCCKIVIKSYLVFQQKKTYYLSGYTDVLPIKSKFG